MRHTLILCAVAFCACKKHETVQQSAAVDTASTAAPTVAVTAPSVSVTAETIASAPVASVSASAAPSATPTIDKDLARQAALSEAREFGMIGLVPEDGGRITIGGVGTGVSIGRPATGHPSTSVSIRQGTTTVNGRLPPEVIQRIVRQNFGRFRLCYENGLRNNPSLQGRVVTRYIIDHDGSVKVTQDNGSDLPDQTVVQCVVKAFGNISYPQPEGGIVTVVFPLIFSPGS